MMVQSTSTTYSSSLLEIVATGNGYSRDSRIAALNILAGVQPGLSPQDTPKLTCVIHDLTKFICEQRSDYQHEALSTLDHILNTQCPLPKDLDYYLTLGDLITALEKTTVEKTQRKIAQVMSTLLTHILLNSKTDKKGMESSKKGEFCLIAEERRESMKQVLEKVAKLKEKEQKKASKSEEAFHINYYLNYNIEALKLLLTDKSNKEKWFEAALGVLGGLTLIVVEKKVVSGLLMFKEAFDAIDIKKGWFPIALGLKGLELNGAKIDPNATKQLINEAKATIGKKNEESTYQALLSLSRVALLGETKEIRDLATAPLEQLKNSTKPELIQGYLRHLAKVSNHGKTLEERSKAKEALLSLKVEGSYAARKKEGVTEGSTKQKATAEKMKKFCTFDAEAEKVLNPSKMPQTPPKAIPKNNEAPSSSPQGSPPPSAPSLLGAVSPKYRQAKPAEAVFARVVGTSWDDFWKTWLKFEATCTPEELNSLSIRGNNSSEMRWNEKSFELAAKFLNQNPNYKTFDLTFSDYNVDELADFLPQVDNRNEMEFFLRNEAEYTVLAKALFKKGLHNVSRNLLEKAGKKNPSFMESPEFLARLGLVSTELEPANSQKVELLFKKSININPNHYKSLFFYSCFLEKAGRWNECFETLRKAIQSNKNEYYAYYELARNLTTLYRVNNDKKLIDEAKEMIDIAFKLNDEDAKIISVKEKIYKLI